MENENLKWKVHRLHRNLFHIRTLKRKESDNKINLHLFFFDIIIANELDSWLKKETHIHMHAQSCLLHTLLNKGVELKKKIQLNSRFRADLVRLINQYVGHKNKYTESWPSRPEIWFSITQGSHYTPNPYRWGILSVLWRLDMATFHHSHLTTAHFKALNEDGINPQIHRRQK